MNDLDQLLAENAALHSTVDMLQKRISVLEQSAMIVGIIIRLLLKVNQGTIAVSSAVVADMMQHITAYEIKVDTGELPHGLVYRLVKRDT